MNPFAANTASTAAKTESSGRIAMVPLETELGNLSKQKEVLDKLSGFDRLLQRLMRGDSDQEVFGAYKILGNAIRAATDVVKTFRV